MRREMGTVPQSAAQHPSASSVSTVGRPRYPARSRPVDALGLLLVPSTSYEGDYDCDGMMDAANGAAARELEAADARTTHRPSYEARSDSHYLLRAALGELDGWMDGLYPLRRRSTSFASRPRCPVLAII